MADFMAGLKAMPQLKDVSPDSVDMMVEDAIAYICGAHRWPFLKQTDVALTWTANSRIKSFDGLSRITSIRVPDSDGRMRPLTKKTDVDLARYKYENPTLTLTTVWQDAGRDGTKVTIELYAVPTSNLALKCGAYVTPAVNTINDLPAFFRRMVRLFVLSEIPNSGVTIANVDFTLRENIAREEDEAGQLEYVGMDELQESRLMDVNDPT